MTPETIAPKPASPSGAKIVALCGSLRPGSFTRLALQIAIKGASDLGAQVTTVDLSEWKLPPFDNTEAFQNADAIRFKALVREADGLLVATPVYHDSFGGMLKNALDLLYDELLEKIAALIAVGGGRTGQGQALEHLRSVFRETGTWVIPRQVVVGSSETAFDETGKLKEADLEKRLNVLGQELVLRCRKMRPKR